MWKRMLARFRPKPSDDELKAAAQRETQRLMAELERMNIRIELAMHREIKQLEHELLNLSERTQ